MSEELKFSMMAHGQDSIDALQSILAQFEAEKHIHVNLQPMSWEAGWAELVQFALHGNGPDVSEIGSTWVGSLAAMNALRPFNVREIATVSGRYAFLHPSWQSGYLTGEPEMWAIPWLSNVRLMFYRRDLFQQAGLDEQTAFQSPIQLDQTLARLQAAGVAIPFVMPTANALNILHTAAAWVWGAGGSFSNAGSKLTGFNSPQAYAGFRAYFDLQRHLTPPARGLDTDDAESLFLNGQAAITISDPGLVYVIRHGAAAPEVVDHARAALPPGVPFVGGSNLIVWKHTHHEKEAIELIHYLTKRSVQTAYSAHARSLPVRLDSLGDQPFSIDPMYKPMVEALKIGRSYRVNRLWGLVEKKLFNELNQIWSEIFARPDLDIEAAIEGHLKPLGKELDRLIADR